MAVNKITVIGAGSVGSTTAFALALKNIANEIVIIDINEDKALGEAMDIHQGTPLFSEPVNVYAGDYKSAVGSDIVVITSGVARKPGQTRIDLAQTNVNIIKQITPQIVRSCPDATYVIVANPVDILTYVFSKVSGIPQNRIIGSGTLLDTARLRSRLADYMNVSQKNVHAYVLGEHGDTELPAWSLTSIAGMGMDEYCSLCASCQGSLSQTVRAEFDDKVRNAAYRIIEGKGATFYAVALAVRRIVEAILRDEQSILTVSSLLTGQYGLDGVCLSLPCIVGVNGVEQVLPIHLSDEEMAQLRTSADAIRAAIRLMDEPVE